MGGIDRPGPIGILGIVHIQPSVYLTRSSFCTFIILHRYPLFRPIYTVSVPFRLVLHSHGYLASSFGFVTFAISIHTILLSTSFILYFAPPSSRLFGLYRLCMRVGALVHARTLTYLPFRCSRCTTRDSPL